MNRLQRMVVLTALCRRMREMGSLCGETHIQKATYFLQTVARIPLGFSFVLYRFGPFSFDLRDELIEMQADDLLRPHPQGPYGPTISPTGRSEKIVSKFPVTLGRYGSAIAFVVDALGNRPAAALEQLGMALYLKTAENLLDPVRIAGRLCEAKPYVSHDEGDRAARDMLAIFNAWDRRSHASADL